MIPTGVRRLSLQKITPVLIGWTPEVELLGVSEAPARRVLVKLIKKDAGKAGILLVSKNQDLTKNDTLPGRRRYRRACEVRSIAYQECSEGWMGRGLVELFIELKGCMKPNTP